MPCCLRRSLMIPSMIHNVLLFTSVVLFALIYATPITTSYYWKPRELKCEYYGGNNTRCSLIDPQIVFEQNPGCFEELDSMNITRVYCGLNCDESEETTIVSKKPQWNHHCSAYFTYNLERRRRDWYLWRSGTCINETISFQISCGTHRDPRVFYYNNEHLFEYEDAE